MATRKKLTDNALATSDGMPLDALFGGPKSTANVANPTDKKTKNAVPEPRPTRFDDIRNYYKDSPRGKQLKVYVPADLQSAVKAKAAQNDKSMSEFLIGLIVDHALSDRELKDAYDKARD